MNNRAQILITAVDQTRGAFDALKRNLGDLGNAARSLNGLLGSLGVAISAAGLGAMVKSALDSADALSKLSQKVGISVESLSTLIPVADLAGISSDKLEAGLRKLATRMLDAATGSDEAAHGFAALGVALQNPNGSLRMTDQVLLDLADRFKAMPDSATKTALAVDLFGKSGADLIPFLNQGRDGIAALTTEMQALGVQIGGDTAAQAEVFNDAIAKVRLATSGMGNQIIEAFLPALNEMANGMVESAKQGGSLRASLDGVVLLLKTLALGAATVGKSFVTLGEAMGGGMAAAVTALSGNGSGARAILADLKASIARRMAELAEFHDRLFNPKPIQIQAPAISPAIQAEPGLIDRLRRPERASDRPADPLAGQMALARAQADAELKQLKDALERQSRVLDTALDERLIALSAYYAAKTALEIREIDAGIARARTLLAEQQRIVTSGADEGTRLKARADIVKIEADLIVLNHQRADVEVANARKSAVAERELADALREAREELAQITGQASTAGAGTAIERGYRDLRARLAAESDADGVSLVDRLIDVKAAQARLAALEDAWRQVTERMHLAQEALRIQAQAGLLTEAQARQQIVALQQQSASEMQRLLPAMQQAAQALGPDAVLRVQAWHNEMARTRLVVDEMAPLWNRIGQSFGNALQGMLTGAQTWQSALANLFQQVADAFLQQIVIQPFQQWIAMQARMLALKLGFVQQAQVLDTTASATTVAAKSAETAAVVSMDAAQAGAGAAASQASIPYVGPALALAAMAAMVAAVMGLLGNARKFATGGLVTGPGTSHSDSIPARLSAGEFVIHAAAVKRVGVDFLYALNGLSRGPQVSGRALAFASGGLVTDAIPDAIPAEAVPAQPVRIVNVLDPELAADYLNSAAGERTILNVIHRNGSTVRQLLR